MHPTSHLHGKSRTSAVEPVSHRSTRKVGHGLLQSNYATDISKYTLEGNNKMINVRVNTMRSNHTSILRIDSALIPLLGFDANNKNLFLHNPKFPKDLSTSNVVTVNRSSEMYPRRPNTGIMLPHKS
jgi:hypothetical protein